MKATMLIIVAAVASFAALAAEVTEDEAREAVRGWAALGESLTGGTRFSASAISDVKEYSGKDGKGTYYVVSFEGGGFAVASGDTDMEPILAYSAEGEWVDDEAKNPLMAILGLDVAAASSGNGESSFAKATEDKRATEDK